jgi:MFS superfamily sulfate permease-like transporter
MRYICGPYDGVYFDNLIADVSAGITVSLTLIPQGKLFYELYS